MYVLPLLSGRFGFVRPWLQSSSIAVLILLAACVAPPLRTPATPGAQAAANLQPPADARVYDVVAAESIIRIQVYREGALASAGHNHVIAVRELRGKVYLARELERSVVQLEFAADTLSVDDPELRVAAGPEFPRDVPDSARNGTRDNLRGPGVLDAAQFPLLRLQARVVGTQAPQQLRLATTLNIKGRDVALEIPLLLEQTPGTIVASGELPLRQSELGLTPFSVMMGALRVRDEMQISYRIVARAAP